MRCGIILGLVAVAGCASGGRLRDRFHTANDISVLASPHSGMLSNPNYTVKDFASAIAQFHPDLILSEVRPRHDGPVEGSLDGGVEQSLVYAMAKNIGAKVIPVDWYNETSSGGDPWAPLTEEQRQYAMSLRAKYSRGMGQASVLELNSPEFQKKVKDYNSYVEMHGLISGRERMDQICLNMREALTHLSGQRILVIFGSEQKYAIDECVDSLIGQRARQVISWYLPSKAIGFKLPPAVKTSAMDSILGAESLLDQRLRSNYYPSDMKTRGVSKLVSLKGWKRAMERQ